MIANDTPRTLHPKGLLVTATVLLACAAAHAQTFTYQGRLDDAGLPASGSYDLRFRLYTGASSDILLNTQYLDDLAVADGLFSATLDLGPFWNGLDRFLEIAVRPGSWSNQDRQENTYTILGPRQEVQRTPYAAFADKAGGLDIPIEENYNALFPLVSLTNDSHIALKATSDNGSAIWAESEAGNGLYSYSNTGWAGFFNGMVHVTDRLSINYGNLTTLKLACNGSAAKPGGGAWSTLSDARCKQNIRPLTGALDRVLALQGYTYEYTPAAQERGLALPGEQIGFVAQQVESVFPDWVEQEPDGTKFVTERGTTALFVEALRELRAEHHAEIDALRAAHDAELTALRAELDALRAETQAALGVLSTVR
jgi:hypothetical protein